ncbi:MAG: alpha/beta hydrolase [Polyangiales bacterium]
MTTATRSKLLTWGFRVARVLAISYLAACVGLYAFQRKLLFPAPNQASTIGAGLRIELVTTKASDGVDVHAAYAAAEGAKPTIVWLHGNGEDMGGDVNNVVDFRRHTGVGGLAVEYRGYGLSQSSGSPSETGLYADAEAALRWLEQKGVARDRTVVVGRSLGTGVAAEMATRGLVGRLILVSPYTSIPDVGALEYPMMPVRLLARDRFDTRSKAAQITAETLVIHGDQDELIPYSMGTTLAAAIPHARLVTVSGGHHNDVLGLNHPEAMTALLAFANDSAR